METVAFYSYKGGVGRTLLVARTAQSLARSGRHIVALDLDLEAPGLHYKLGSRAIRRGAVDELLDALEDGPRNRNVRETALHVDLHTAGGSLGGSLHLVPAGSAPSQAYWAALERLNHALRGTRRNGGLPEAVLELQARIAAEFNPEFLLIDSRTGITELGGLATSLLADRVVCLTTMAPESVEGTLVVAEALRNAPRLSSQGPLRVDFLIMRVPFEGAYSPSVIQAIDSLTRLGSSPTVLPHDPAIAYEDPGDGDEIFPAMFAWIKESFPPAPPS